MAVLLFWCQLENPKFAGLLRQLGQLEHSCGLASVNVTTYVRTFLTVPSFGLGLGFGQIRALEYLRTYVRKYCIYFFI